MQPPVRANDNFLVFGSPAIEEEDIDELVSTMRSGWLGTGPKVARFEKEFAEYKMAKYGAAVNSCTAALHLALVASGIGPGDEVITTPLTFCATANAIIHAGGTPVLADIDSSTMNIDPKEIEAAITPRTKAVIPVHFAGRPCDMEAIVEICQRRSILLIEDCAHAIESTYKGQHVGGFGSFGCFSFYVTKNLVTGEGGMVLTKDRKAIDRIKILALHGMTKDAWKRFGDDGFRHYQVVEAGFKYNMMDVQAAIGLNQLKRIEAYWHRRQQIWAIYDNAFSQTPLVTPAPLEPGTRHAYHLYNVLVDSSRTEGLDRDSFLAGMNEQNIGVGVHYLSLPEHPFYQERFGWEPADFPNATRIGRQTVSLPLSAKLTDNDVSDVVEAVTRVLRV